MCDVLTWVKQEDQFSPSLVLWHDGEPVTPKVAIYQGDAGYTVSGTGHTQTFKRLHKAMRYGEAYIIDKEAFDNYGTLVRIHIEVSDEPIIEPEDERVTVEFDETERAPEDEDGDDEPECPCFVEGYEEGYDEGYDDGFDDGIDQAYDDARANIEEDMDAQLALECDKALHAQDKKANILIGFAIGLGSAAIASLLAVLLHFVSWA